MLSHSFVVWISSDLIGVNFQGKEGLAGIQGPPGLPGLMVRTKLKSVKVQPTSVLYVIEDCAVLMKIF